eukprot:14729933-Ditylum_brightwellii.AAC.1
MFLSSEYSNEEIITDRNTDKIPLSSIPDLMPYADNDENICVKSKCSDESLAGGVLVDGIDS